MSSSGAERVLLTGGRGFVGQRLAAALAQAHPEWALTICGGPHDSGFQLDVADAGAASSLVERLQPTMLVHLAAVSAVTASIADPRAAWRVNLGGTLNITEALTRHAPDCHLLYVSSAEVYGRTLADGKPATEAALLQPLNPYAASKAAADILVRQCAAGGLSATVARPFNHTGCGQSEAFVVPAFAAQIARIEAGLQPPVIRVGSLEDERDFLDVADVVAAYVIMLESRDTLERGEVFNVASGKPQRIGDVLETLLSSARSPIRVEVDPERLRSSSASRVAGDASKLREVLGWRPQILFDETLRSVLDGSRTLMSTTGYG